MSNPFIAIIQSFLPEPEASLLAGMLFGRSTRLPRELYEALVRTGTIHLVALSGMNLTILANFIAKAAYPLGRRLSTLISIFGITAFIFFVGPSPTVIRAGIMAVLSLSAPLFGRQSSVFLNLFLAGFVMTIINPEIVKNVSFQLSFLSTLGILVFAPAPLKSEADASENPEDKLMKNLIIEIVRIFRENLRTTLAAQTATLPIIVFNFARISLISPLTNLLVGWVVSPVMILGMIASLSGFLYYPLGQIIAFFIYPLLHFLVKTVEITAQLPWAVLKLD